MTAEIEAGLARILEELVGLYEASKEGSVAVILDGMVKGMARADIEISYSATEGYRVRKSEDEARAIPRREEGESSDRQDIEGADHRLACDDSHHDDRRSWNISPDS